MALCETGAVVGSVSGGCIEDDLIYRYSRANTPEGSAAIEGISHDIPVGPPERVTYGVTADEAHRFGLPCGGTLELLLEFNPEVAPLETLVQTLTDGHMMERHTAIATGEVTLRARQQAPGPERRRHHPAQQLWPRIPHAADRRRTAHRIPRHHGAVLRLCRHRVRPARRVPGQLAGGGCEARAGMPDDVVEAFNVDRRTCVIALTHDPKLDDLALLEALGSEAFYVGAIGSRRNNEARRARMIEHFDQTEESLAAMRGPIGIYIGSKTPPEIAVSVMAEVLALKNAVPLPRDMQVGPAKEHLQPGSGSAAVCFSSQRAA